MSDGDTRDPGDRRRRSSPDYPRPPGASGSPGDPGGRRGRGRGAAPEADAGSGRGRRWSRSAPLGDLPEWDDGNEFPWRDPHASLSPEPAEPSGRARMSGRAGPPS